MTSDPRYNPYTGSPVVPGGIDSISPSVRLGLEPPRYCAECGRRMIGQIVPEGWKSECSRHGLTDSASIGRR